MMRAMTRRRKWLLLAAVLLLGLIVAKDAIARLAITSGVRAATGLPLSIHRLTVGVFRPRIEVGGLELFNPPGFPESRMLAVPQLSMDYDPTALLRGHVHLRELRLEVQEFLVVKNAQGQLNLDAVRVVQNQKATGHAVAPAPRSTLQIDVLDLAIGRVLVKDYSGGGPPRVQEFPIHLHRRYEQITNVQALTSVVLVEALANTTIARLLDFDLTHLAGDVHGILRSATTLATDTLGTLTETGVGTAKKSVNLLKRLLPSGDR